MPARWSSRRLPGKVAAIIGGQSMLERVWRATVAAPGFARVLVATDSPKVVQLARGFGADVALTGPASSGTARASLLAPDDVAVAVVQADQPFLDPDHLGALRDSVSRSPIGTLWSEWSGDPADLDRVKIRIEIDRVLDFAREPWPDAAPRRHVGMYAFRPGWLGRCTQGPPTARAIRHDLEQLSWLDQGFEMAAHHVSGVGPSVDTWPQLVRARARMAEST
ncbi:MAG: NTP transferase domain-containing protein [Myxococcota bacterium]